MSAETGVWAVLVAAGRGERFGGDRPKAFAKLGDRLTDRGSPMADGRVLHRDGTISGSATRLNGYSIVQAEDVNDLLGLVKDHPYQALGGEYSIEAYSLD